MGVGAGSKALKRAADQLGFQQKTGIEIGWEESVGLVGDEDLGRERVVAGRNRGRFPWIPEDMASASIGQSVVQITPLQLARAYAVFANGGWLVTPHLAQGTTDWLDADHRRKVPMKASTLATIRAGLRKVVSAGTGFGLNGPGIPAAAGKTGTAEDSTGGPDHAWFGCPMPRIPMVRLLWSLSPRTPLAVDPCMPCRWRKRSWRNGIEPVRTERSGRSAELPLQHLPVIAP